jgi:4-amino-4-deoxy-L-arabinose transferase-like glycosyltransferase
MYYIENPMETVSKPVKLFLLLLSAAVYISGLFVPVMDIDASTYAFMSRQIAESHDFWKSLLEPQGFLDKPPLLFFLSALSFKIFGASTVTYKLPSLLVTLLGFYATFRLGALLYDKRTGMLAAVMLCCCEAFIFFTNDVRTDAILAGAVIFGTWQVTAFLKTKKYRYFIGGFCGIGFAMLAKGPLGLMVPALAIGSYLAGLRDWRAIFKGYWLLGFVIIGALLAPMLAGLYHQYGWYGIRFFFWTQSFGRITGESHWNNGSDHFFFVHTFLWAFLPWAFTAYYVIGERLVAAIRRRFDAGCAADMLLLGGIIFPFIALSFSHYKLPHYIFVIFPLTAILTARTVVGLADNPQRKTARGILYTQLTCSGLGWAFLLYILTLVFPCRNFGVWTAVALLGLLTIFAGLPKQGFFKRTVVAPVITILGVSLLLNTWFYPHLLSFQGGSTAAGILRHYRAPPGSLRACRVGSAASDFYAGIKIPVLDSARLAEQAGSRELWIYTDSTGKAWLANGKATILSADSFPNFGVSMVTPKFLYFKTRPQAVRTQYILHAAPEGQTPAGN